MVRQIKIEYSLGTNRYLKKHVHYSTLVISGRYLHGQFVHSMQVE